MSKTLLLPRLGETMEQGRVVEWFKRPGDSFVRGETIVEIETDKTVVEMPALADGVLRQILADVGEDVDVGAPLGEYDVIGEEANAAPEEAPVPAAAVAQTAAAASEVRAAVVHHARADTLRLRATPAARRAARQGGIALDGIAGTGRRGRIERQDVEVRVNGAGAASAAPAEGVLYRNLARGRVAYREWRPQSAAGAPLVLLHGFSGDAQVWSALASQLQRRGRHVIAPDLPSHGATDFDSADVASMADAMAALIDDLGIGSFELVGHSLGAAVAAKVAMILKAKVQRLTLIAPAGLGTEIDDDFIDGMAHVKKGGGLMHLLRRSALNPPLLSAQQLDQMADAIRTRGALVALADNLVSGGRQQIDIRSELAGLNVPARVIWGLDDQIIPWHHASRAGPEIPVHFIPQAGHMPHWDQPQKVAALFV
ncbi:acetoin dehydrogenase dihydrolipoyllysine-residue acetyltransferase subunit [Caballeronia telluris]|uniref:Branched-chain alpha-keto acid dehydrogenase subunit E2 n=1 Tax=Caballeronia telluris TaxID=326475 RepID=A0A158JZ68_9BURK|nr:acetoin dehydrogenase dihydrolipoyllysine-residue acetyltransferase subunit [Caballeronia telluris]SAL74035.1 branched-chain alpha-keto acid dehydrogenase subunit E2 [Caballeronia telluris]